MLINKENASLGNAAMLVQQHLEMLQERPPAPPRPINYVARSRQLEKLRHIIIRFTRLSRRPLLTLITLIPLSVLSFFVSNGYLL